MHTRSDYLPVRACVEAKSGDIIKSQRARLQLVGYTPGVAAARWLARRWA